MTMVSQEGLFPTPSVRIAAAPAAREAGAAQRLVASLRWFSLDERLAAGEDPSRSALLAAQAARLTRRRHRDRLAAALGGLLLAAERAPRVSRVGVDRSALQRHESAVRQLARRVESDQALYARGLARLERLLSDSTGPAFRGGAGDLAVELERIEAQLSGRPGVAPAGQRVASGSRGGSVRRLARLRSGNRAGPALDPAAAPRGSFALPDGSWFHGRRESA